MPSYTVHSDKVEIEAPIEFVWGVLIDLDDYHEWNPFTTRVDSTLNVGEPVDLYVKLGSSEKLQIEQVREVSAPHTLSWGMSMGANFILKALREQKLQALSDTKCTYRTTDAFEGLLTSLVVKLYGEKIRIGFNDMAYALKNRAEKLYQDQV